MVIINDYDWIKEAFKQKEFNGRPNFILSLLLVGGARHGTLTSEVLRRSVIISHLKKTYFDCYLG